jgi:hypothetical protein
MRPCELSSGSLQPLTRCKRLRGYAHRPNGAVVERPAAPIARITADRPPASPLQPRTKPRFVLSDYQQRVEIVHPVRRLEV